MKTSSTLFKDVIFFEKLMKDSRKQIWRRAYVRAAFAFIDACTYELKDLVFKSFGTGLLNDDELSFITEIKYKKGAKTKKKYYLSTTKSWEYLFDIVISFMCNEHKLIKGENWKYVKKAISIRNNITHPKKHKTIKITDEHIFIIRKALLWFIDNLQNFLFLLAKYHKKNIDHLRKIRQCIEEEGWTNYLKRLGLEETEDISNDRS
ncbi:MAG: hypothetical protein KKG02_11005 [Candidatus Edwardsbacteria bacterium]|nr:hypothetical protein [Candidatus Edwardsbacteria bacterium]